MFKDDLYDETAFLNKGSLTVPNNKGFAEEGFVVYYDFNPERKLQNVKGIFDKRFKPTSCWDNSNNTECGELEAYYYFENGFLAFSKDEDSAEIFLNEIEEMLRNEGLAVKYIRWLGSGDEETEGQQLLMSVEEVREHMFILENGDEIIYRSDEIKGQGSYFLWDGELYSLDEPMPKDLPLKHNKTVGLFAYHNPSVDNTYSLKTIRGYYSKCLKNHQRVEVATYSNKKNDFFTGIILALQKSVDQIVLHSIERYLLDFNDFLRLVLLLNSYSCEITVIKEAGDIIEGSAAIEYLGKQLMLATANNSKNDFFSISSDEILPF